MRPVDRLSCIGSPASNGYAVWQRLTSSTAAVHLPMTDLAHIRNFSIVDLSTTENRSGHSIQICGGLTQPR
jgi:hypothetical protein